MSLSTVPTCLLLPRVLQSVLNRGNPALIRNTVKQLPLAMMVPLVRELTKRVYKHAQGGLVSLKWVRVVLMTHTAYLMSVRTRLYGSLVKLCLVCGWHM